MVRCWRSQARIDAEQDVVGISDPQPLARPFGYALWTVLPFAQVPFALLQHEDDALQRAVRQLEGKWNEFSRQRR